MKDTLTPRLNQLKQEIFNPDPDDPIILHRKDIIQRNYPFHVLRNLDLAARFDRGLLGLLRDSEYTVLTVVIDKLDHLNRYASWRYAPYHYCLEVLLERYALWLNRRQIQGDVMGEVRGGKVDRRLETSFTRHYNRGTSFVRKAVIQRRLTSKNLKLRTKEKNITGLQIADLLAHPSALYVRSHYIGDVKPQRFGLQIVNLLTSNKYDRDGRGKIDGWGIKWLP